VNPLFIGTAERRLFGIYEPAAPSRGKPRAAVLCYPLGSEYIYAHRSLRQLAARLAAAGFHTLRFDYFGTGDSSGETAQSDLVGSFCDAEAAIEALKDIAGTPKITLIGLRVGANIAVGVASRHPSEVDSLVLWDPIVSGEQYVQSLQAPPVDEIGDNMLRDLRSIDLRSSLGRLPNRSMILVTERLPDHEQLGVPVEYVSAACPWVESITTSGALPVPAIQRIEEWLR
jgi:pimeloyl-ACP methyl ester carboxylesterase